MFDTMERYEPPRASNKGIDWSTLSNMGSAAIAKALRYVVDSSVHLTNVQKRESLAVIEASIGTVGLERRSVGQHDRTTFFIVGLVCPEHGEVRDVMIDSLPRASLCGPCGRKRVAEQKRGKKRQVQPRTVERLRTMLDAVGLSNIDVTAAAINSPKQDYVAGLRCTFHPDEPIPPRTWDHVAVSGKQPCPRCAFGDYDSWQQRVDERHGDGAVRLVEWSGDSMEKSRFQCSEGHSWQASVNSVVNNGVGCSRCNLLGGAAAFLKTGKEMRSDSIGIKGILAIAKDDPDHRVSKVLSAGKRTVALMRMTIGGKVYGKIGIFKNTAERRYLSNGADEVEVLWSSTSEALVAYMVEQTVKRTFSADMGVEELRSSFTGWTECFDERLIEPVLSYCEARFRPNQEDHEEEEEEKEEVA